ncbi:MAG: hypothetical protein GF311_10605 [Candidatus Lokiarchaeota archaeon]|nr:hypothetical protein [Candidatus Lokiarchaeota archaeon]
MTMKENNAPEPIPEEIAIRICQEIRERNQKKRISFSKMQCWGCMKFSDFDDRGSCIYGDPETHRGCQLVNKVFDTLEKNE